MCRDTSAKAQPCYQGGYEKRNRDETGGENLWRGRSARPICGCNERQPQPEEWSDNAAEQRAASACEKIYGDDL
jgi:hypothetical protein